MTIITIPQVLENKLLEIAPSIDTVYPNTDYQPVEGAPFQRVYFRFAKPTQYINRKYVQPGFMQVTLFYPVLTGAADARFRAQTIREKFKSGSIFSGVNITATPEIGAENNEGDRFILPVFIQFSQFIEE